MITVNEKLGRMLLMGGLAILLLLFAWEVFADEPHVIEVRRNIPMGDHDPIYKDFYINAGSEAGFKQNQVVVAVRKTNVKDATGAQSFGELLVPVGQLKIIFAQNHIAVAREYKLLTRDDLPMLEQVGIMTGDLIDLKGAFIDNRKSSAKTSVQKEATPPPTENKEAEVKITAPEMPATPRTEAPKEAGKESAADPQQDVMKTMADAMGQVANKSE